MKPGRGRLLLVALALVVMARQADAIELGSWNVQVFGTTKMADPVVANILVQSFRKWDLALIMEIRDTTNTAIFDLLSRINNYDGPQYDLALSPRLGPTTSKVPRFQRPHAPQEQYGFFYRRDAISVVDQYEYSDNVTCVALTPSHCQICSAPVPCSLPTFSWI
jgi:hypothetical protein